MSRKKKNYNIMVKKRVEKTREIWGCSDPSVIDGSTCCDGDCTFCSYKTIEIVKYIDYK